MKPTFVNEKTLTLDDFFHLQSLLDYEQQARVNHIQQCENYNQEKKPQHSSPALVHIHPVHPIQFRRAIDSEAAIQSRLEKARLAEALTKLKWLKDQYRRQRVMEVEIFLENYRRQAFVRAVLQEEEERYYRQCIAAALEQRRIELCLQHYMDLKQQEALRAQFERQKLSDNNDDALQYQRKQPQLNETEDDEAYNEYHYQKLAALLKHIFAQQNREETELACKKQDETAEEQAQAMAQVWQNLSNQKVIDETPRSAFLPSEHNAILGNTATKAVQKETTSASEFKSKEKHSVAAEVDQLKENAFAPVLEHVVSLQDLVRQLASEPVLINEQTAQYDNEPATEQTPHKQQRPVNTFTEDKEESTKPYLPQHIFTEAEPTPTMENMPNTPLGAQEMDQEEDQENQHFVDTVAAEQKNEIAPPDPRKLKALEELDAISNHLLEPSSELLQRLQKGVNDDNQRLSFSKQKDGTLLLTASTDFNRAFLGSEDELMRVILKLDAVDSFGDASIREKRKKLVKDCESMLDSLDQFKQKQWEKAKLLPINERRDPFKFISS